MKRGWFLDLYLWKNKRNEHPTTAMSSRVTIVPRFIMDLEPTWYVSILTSCLYLNLRFIKETVSVISNNPPCINGHSWFTTVSVKTLSDQVYMKYINAYEIENWLFCIVRYPWFCCELVTVSFSLKSTSTYPLIFKQRNHDYSRQTQIFLSFYTSLYFVFCDPRYENFRTLTHNCCKILIFSFLHESLEPSGQQKSGCRETGLVVNNQIFPFKIITFKIKIKLSKSK